MKKKLLFASTVFMALSTTYAQEGVGIGKSLIPDATSVLDIGATDKGILIPRVTLTGEGDDKTIKGGAYPESLLVYNQGIAGNPFAKGFYFWSDGKWNALVSKTSTTTSEVLTTLEISADGEKVVLTYTGEDKLPVALAVSDRLQKDPSFNTYIKSLVTSTAAGVELVAGDGITVVAVPPAAGETVTKYTISANPVGITLAGDVTGKGTETVVERINGVNVAKPSDADFGLALVYDETTKTWKPGKPKIDNTSVTDKANLTVDSSLDFSNGTGTGALLSATGLKVKTGGITDTHLAADAVTEAKIAVDAVTETKILDGAVTTGKIKGGTKGQVLISGDDNATAWGSIQETAVAGGAGVTVTDAIAGNVKTYTVTTNPTTLTLVGDVSGNAGATSVDKIKGVDVAKPSDADFGLALVYDEATKTWKPGKPKIDNTSVTDKANLTVDSSLDFTNGTGTGALLSATGLKVKAGGITDTHLAADAVTTTKIADKNVTSAKIAGGTKGQVLVSGDNNATAWVDQTAIVPASKTVTVDNSIELIGGVGAVLADTELKVKAGGITDTHLAADAVTTTKIADKNVTSAKIAGGTKGQVLVSGDNNATAWVDQTAIVPASKTVTVDNSIELIGGVGAVLADTELKVKAGGIADTHLAADAVTTTKIADKNVTSAKIAGGTDGQVLVSDATGSAKWVGQSAIRPVGVELKGDESITVMGGTKSLLEAAEIKVSFDGITESHLADNAVTRSKIRNESITTEKILDKSVTVEKIAGGTGGQILRTNSTGTVSWVDQTTIVPASKTVKVDNSIELIGGVGAVLTDTELKVKAGGIADTHLAVGAVTETKILDAAVTTLKIKDEAVTLGKLAKGTEADLVLTTGAGGVPTWTKKDLIATKKDLTTDGVIVIGDATSTVTSLVGAVMQPTTLSLKDNSVLVSKLATIAAKNQHLVTDEAGKPKWESKAVNITNTPTLLNEALDGKKVYSVTISGAAVVAPTANTGLTYNSEMSVPIAADFEYLLSVQIFDKNKKLVMSTATDGTVANGKLTFRFGGNGMYLTLPVAADYKVVLKYASNQNYVN